MSESLLEQRKPEGYWEGELSSSALSTATAVFALHLLDAALYKDEIMAGLKWLRENVNNDGAWGDTVRSKSNISTAALCWAALNCSVDKQFVVLSEKVEKWIAAHCGSTEIEVMSKVIIQRYGKDKSFSIPIVTMVALSGRWGEGKRNWNHISALPFELAAFPRRLFAALKMPVVSYALPALIAMGQLHFFKKPTYNPFLYMIRLLSRNRTLKILKDIQPESGGYLESTPLTSFVLMCLATLGLKSNPVTVKGKNFILSSQRKDGSWAIDSNLSTWVSTLAINAMAVSKDFKNKYTQKQREQTRDWLLEQQFKTIHSYTSSPPGGWAWTNLSGALPDADDTAGALIALWHLDKDNEEVIKAAKAGITWLIGLQNKDGGMPTFCRGWGYLPFDRSGSDLSAHALRAFKIWRKHLEPTLLCDVDKAIKRLYGYLQREQHQEGYWLPLWFGNQNRYDENNPIYGTARVLMALEVDRPMAQKGCAWLIDQQDTQGSWGSVEETALALSAISCYKNMAEFEKSYEWLKDNADNPAEPIGFYFAKLWYYEKLYPLIFVEEAFNCRAMTTL